MVASRYRADILLTGRSRDHKFRQCFPWQMRSLNTGLPVSVFEYFTYEIRKRYRRPWKPAKERCNRDKFFLGPRPRVRKPHKHAHLSFLHPSFFPISISSYTVTLYTLCSVKCAEYDVKCNQRYSEEEEFVMRGEGGCDWGARCRQKR